MPFSRRGLPRAGQGAFSGARFDLGGGGGGGGALWRRGGGGQKGAELLQAQGYKVENLAGGILGWANEVDPKVAKY